MIRLLLLLLPPRGSQSHHMGLVRPFPFGAGGAPKRSIQAIAPNMLAAFGGNMLGELQEKPHYRKGLRLEVVGVGRTIHDGVRASLVDEEVAQRDGGVDDVLGQRLDLPG